MHELKNLLKNASPNLQRWSLGSTTTTMMMMMMVMMTTMMMIL
jgi:hypothetical protein